MGVLISRRKRAKVDTKDVSTQRSQLPQEVEYLETQQATGSAGDSLMAVLQAIDKRLNAQQLHAPQDEKSSLTVRTRTPRQGEEDTSGSGGFASKNSIFAVPGTNTHASRGVQAAGEAGDGCADIGADAHGTPEDSTGKSRAKRSHSVKDRQPSFHFRAPKITPRREDVRSVGAKPDGIPRLPTADDGEQRSAGDNPTLGGPKENALVLEVDSCPKDAEVVPEVKNVVQPRHKEHMVVDANGFHVPLGYLWQPRELPVLHKKSACRHSRRKHKNHRTSNFDLGVWCPQTLEEELEMLSVEEILQAGSNSRFQGDVLEVEAMTATGGFVSCTLAKLVERSDEQRRSGFGEASRMQVLLVSLIVDQFQKVHVGQGMWPLEQTADNFVQEDQNTSDETDGDIAEDTLDCNVDDRISSPPVCCGCGDVDWDTLECETGRSVTPTIDNSQPGGNSERKATGTMDSTEGCKEEARRTEATMRQAKSQVASELLMSPKTSDSNKTYLPPLPVMENKYIPHWNRNSPCGESRDEEVGATLRPASKMADEEPRQFGGGDSPIVCKEGDAPEGAALGSSSRNSKPELFKRRLSASGSRVEKSFAQRKVSFDSTSDTYLLQLDMSSNRPTSRECEEETSLVLQDQLLLQYFQSLQITEAARLKARLKSRDVDAKCLVPPLDLDAAFPAKSSNKPDVTVSTPDGLDSNSMSYLREAGGDSSVRVQEQENPCEQENPFHNLSNEYLTQVSLPHSSRDLESDSCSILQAVNYVTSPTSISVISEEQTQAHTCLSSFTSLVSIGVISEEESQVRACISSTTSLVHSDIIYEGQHQDRISIPAYKSLSKTSMTSATELQALCHTSSLQDLYSPCVSTDCVNRVMGKNGSAGKISCLDESSTNPEDDVHFRDRPKDKCVPAGNGNVNESNVSGLPGLLEYPQIDEMQTNKKNWLTEIPEEANPDGEQNLRKAGLILVQGKAPTYLASLTECENISSGEQMEYDDHDEALFSRLGRSQRAARIYKGFAFSSLQHPFAPSHSLKTTDYWSQMLQHN